MQIWRAGVTATILLCLSGCALFFGDETGEKPGLVPSFPWANKNSRPTEDFAPMLQMARLEASIVTRPANDARVRRHVWEELDESGLMAPDVRGRLNQSGFRIGVAGSATPWALQSLAKEAVKAHRMSDDQPFGDLSSVGPSFQLMANGKSILEVQSQLDARRLPVNDISELAGLRDRNALRCVFEVSVKELQDDWVLLNVLPQIHSGAAAPRLSVSGMSEQLPVRQNVLPLYDQQFTIKLLTGEIAVIGRLSSSDWNLGRLFFQPDDGPAGSERLMMIRLVGVEKLRGQSDPNFLAGSFDR